MQKLLRSQGIVVAPSHGAQMETERLFTYENYLKNPAPH